MAKGSVIGRDPYMKGKTKLYRRYEVIVELGHQPVRTHTRPLKPPKAARGEPRAKWGGCPGRVWIADDPQTTTCPRCGEPLELTGAERRQHRLYKFTNKRKAEEALTEAVAAHNKGDLLMPSSTTLAAYVDAWFARGGGPRKASTLNGYRRELDLHVLPTLGHVELQDLNASHVGVLLAGLKVSGRRDRPGGLAPKTVRSVAMTLRTILRAAVKDRIIAAVPINNDDIPKGEEIASPEMKFWSPQELSDFLASVDDLAWRTVFAVAGSTGMRRGEVAGLRRKDLDLDGAKLHVRSNRVTVRYEVVTTTPKTKKSRRTIALGPNVVAMLREYLATRPAMLPDALVFDVHPDSISQTFDRAIRRANTARAAEERALLPALRFHDLRHTHVAHLIARNMHPAKISARLGHSTVAYTMDRYGHLFPEADTELAEATDIAV